MLPGSMTVIGGDNGQGKSCLVRSIEAFFINRAGKDFIRGGASQCRVAMKLDNGDIYTWVSTKTTALYKFGKVEEKSLGRQTIKDVFENSPFQVERFDSNVIPQITHEKTKVFPFNVTPTVSFRIFNSFLGNPALEKMIVDIKKNLKEGKSEVKKLSGSIETLDSQFRQASMDLSRMPQLAKVRSIKKSITDLNNEYTKFSTSNIHVKDLKKVYDKKLPLYKRFQHLLEEPSILELVEIETDCRQLSKYVTAQNKLNPLRSRGREINVSLRAIGDVKPLGSAMPQLLIKYRSVQDLYKRFKVLDVDVSNETPQMDGIGLNKLDTYYKLQRIYNTYLNTKLRLNTLEERIAPLQVKVSSFKVCPLCGNDNFGENYVECD